MRKISIVAAAIGTLSLGACGTTYAPIDRSSDGYDAIRFLKSVEIEDHAVITYFFAAGATFVADRSSGYGPVYCGQATMRYSMTVFEVCIGVEDPTTIIIGPGGGFKEVKRTVPVGTFERIKVKL